MRSFVALLGLTSLVACVADSPLLVAYDDYLDALADTSAALAEPSMTLPQGQSLPFDNRLVTVRMRGAALRAALRDNVRADDGALGLAGMRVAVTCEGATMALRPPTCSLPMPRPASLDDLLKRREQTLVLAWPGALARYGLAGALSRIVNEAERGDAPAILLVVPSHADGAAPSINGRLPVPAPLPSQRRPASPRAPWRAGPPAR